MTEFEHLAFTRRLWRTHPFSYDGADCILSVCDHLLRMTGVDAAAPWRGTYSDEEGAREIWHAAGGKLALFRDGMARAGFRLAEPAPSWPVVADLFGHEMPGLWTGARVMLRLDGRGVFEAPLPILAAWTR
ncbi:hypothetical protein ATO6_15330 [Oceanicola sp. 22II-s10i]|uniref:DUF6950 family protein n=1 Tax=Oceanicola sp. 22II-s10i TaxID=1317116 RepID=UPI000B528F2B|nr:hypothetical protein [Oceanicola sp. 22II-s10i]OWU83803.1 hypothetical protein ATO6_15330 [Oceanicola sp. 22II-s10i]